MRIVGLDLSLSKTGICSIVDGREVRIQTSMIGSSPKQAISGLAVAEWEMARFGTMLNRIKAVMETVQPELVVIEDFAFGVQGAGARSNAGFGYLVRYYLFAVAKVRFLLISPPQLKKFIAGKASQKGADNQMHGVPKEVVIREVSKLWGIDVDDNNEADAVVLAKIGEAVLQTLYMPCGAAKVEVAKAQLAIVQDLRKANAWLTALQRAA